MPKNAKRRRDRNPKHDEPRAFNSGESRAADFLTIGWLLATFTTLVCELGGAAAVWIARGKPEALGIAALGLVLVVAAVVTGLLSLLLLAAAWKLRIAKPPRGITVFALFVGLAPVAMLTLLHMIR
jgi:hypothetical protein